MGFAMNACLKGIVVMALLGFLGACDGRNAGTDRETEVPAAEKVAPADSTQNRREAETETDAASEAGGKAEATAQGGNVAAEGETSLWIQEARGNRQCEGGGKSLEQSGRQLAENGIKVQESRCGVRTDRMYPSVCGGATGDLLMHRIPSRFLDSALQLGFDPAKPGTYNFSDCPSIPPSAPQEY